MRKKDDPKKEIIKKYKLSEIQAEAILNMRLGSLKKLDERSTKKEITDLKGELNYLNKLVKNKNILEKHITDELKEINEEIDEEITARRTKVNSKNISQKSKDKFLDFLAIESNQMPDNNYEMKLIFSGDAVIRVVAEVIEVALDDQGEPWDTKNKPKHKVL